MTAEEAMQRIEGPRFSAVVNLASDLNTFLRILASQPEIKRLEEEAEQGAGPLVLGRVKTMSAIGTEDGLEHPADAALAAYLWLLESKAECLVHEAAEAVLAAPRCWWAKKIAERVRSAAPA